MPNHETTTVDAETMGASAAGQNLPASEWFAERSRVAGTSGIPPEPYTPCRKYPADDARGGSSLLAGYRHEPVTDGESAERIVDQKELRMLESGRRPAAIETGAFESGIRPAGDFSCGRRH
jgi:hypothetical protein